MLRANVVQCPCTASGDCPALNEVRLLEAIERAVGSAPSSHDGDDTD